MRSLQEIIHFLQKKGHRLTKTRRLLISLFVNNTKPVSALALQSQLATIENPVNKTTIYREIEFLLAERIIKQVNLAGDEKYFETTFSNHHHHLVCTKCKRVDEVDSVKLEAQIGELKKTFEEHKDFKSLDHSLEFYGVCANCS